LKDAIKVSEYSEILTQMNNISKKRDLYFHEYNALEKELNNRQYEDLEKIILKKNSSKDLR
jgi:hypothetical protein